MAKKCNRRHTVPIHPSVKIGGATVGVCGRDVLPGLVVCEYHADPSTVRLLVESLARDLAKARREGK